MLFLQEFISTFHKSVVFDWRMEADCRQRGRVVKSAVTVIANAYNTILLCP